MDPLGFLIFITLLIATVVSVVVYFWSVIIYVVYEYLMPKRPFDEQYEMYGWRGKDFLVSPAEYAQG